MKTIAIILALAATVAASALTWRTDPPNLPEGSKVISIPLGVLDGSIGPGTMDWHYRCWVFDARDTAAAVKMGGKIVWADVAEALKEAKDRAKFSPEVPEAPSADVVALRARITELEAENAKLAAKVEAVRKIVQTGN